jgi:SPOR domain/Protein of unknown function (DUF3551)
MRPMLLAAAIVGAASALTSTAAMPQQLPWCSLYARGPMSCSFVSYEQCIVNVSSLGGSCIRNPHAAAEPAPRDHRRAQSVYDQRPAKQAATSQRSSNQRSTKGRSGTPLPPDSGIPARADSKTLVPLPDHTLLTPPPEFDCEPKATDLDGARGQPQPSPASQTGPSPDVVLRMKLDYERQCYRHVAIILRDQLLKLQAAVGETIQAVGSSRASGGHSALAPNPENPPPESTAPQLPVRTASALDPSAQGTATNAAGSYVQVSSHRTETDAEASFRALQSKYPKVLGDKQAVIRRAELGDKGVYYRAMVGPFVSLEQAAALCGSLKAAGGQCIIQRN